MGHAKVGGRARVLVSCERKHNEPLRGGLSLESPTPGERHEYVHDARSLRPKRNPTEPADTR